MDLDEALLAIPVNPNNFPAKLWRLVNDPQTFSIRWDPSGEMVVIDKQLFETELLSPPAKTSGESPGIFKSTNFTSFIRQLNLYGFRKVIQVVGSTDEHRYEEPITDSLHQFRNPDFKRDHPELLVNLKRLTSANKAKIKAGLEVTCRPPTRFQRFWMNCEGYATAENTGSVLAEQTNRGRMDSSPYPHHSNSSQQLKEYNRTPIPPRAWITHSGNVPSAASYYTDKGIPHSVIRYLPADSPCPVACRSNTVAQCQSTAAVGHKFGTFIHHNPQYQSGFYAPCEVCQCCPSGSLGPGMACCHQTAASCSHHDYYPKYEADYLHPTLQDRDWSSGDGPEITKSTENLDTVFKIADELQGSPKVTPVADLSVKEERT